jgi:hypothetical protein
LQAPGDHLASPTPQLRDEQAIVAGKFQQDENKSNKFRAKKTTGFVIFWTSRLCKLLGVRL